MIEIVWTRHRDPEGRDRFVVTADGHAEAGEYGHDIVCAAVSVLMDTLCESLLASSEVAREDVGVRVIEMRRESGAYRIAADMPLPHTLFGMEAYSVLATVLRGLRLVEASYPDNVRIQTRWE